MRITRVGVVPVYCKKCRKIRRVGIDNYELDNGNFLGFCQVCGRIQRNAIKLPLQLEFIQEIVIGLTGDIVYEVY